MSQYVDRIGSLTCVWRGIILCDSSDHCVSIKIVERRTITATATTATVSVAIHMRNAKMMKENMNVMFSCD